MKVSDMAEDLARLLRDENLVELSVRREGQFLLMRRKREPAPAPAESGSFEAVAAAAAASAEPEELPEPGVPVTSQVVGLFHLAKGLEAGGSVKAGQILGHVESMSINHELRSPAQGSVLEVLAREGEPVEYGQALLLIAEG